MHSSAISCMLCSFDNQHAQQLMIMHAVTLDNHHAKQCNVRHAVVCDSHHAQECNIMHAVILKCDTEQSSCTKLQCILHNHHTMAFCKQQKQQKTAEPPLK